MTVTWPAVEAVTAADPPVQVAIVVTDDVQPTVTVPVKPLTEVMVTEVVLPVVALPAMLIVVGKADSV